MTSALLYKISSLAWHTSPDIVLHNGRDWWAWSCFLEVKLEAGYPVGGRKLVNTCYWKRHSQPGQQMIDQVLYTTTLAEFYETTQKVVKKINHTKYPTNKTNVPRHMSVSLSGSQYKGNKWTVSSASPWVKSRFFSRESAPSVPPPNYQFTLVMNKL